MNAFTWQDGTRETYAEAIYEAYGFRSRRDNDLYLDVRSGRVYCGSEYICKVDRVTPDNPAAAKEWTKTIHAAGGQSFSLNVAVLLTVVGVESV